jgi:hypothetical protein
MKKLLVSLLLIFGLVGIANAQKATLIDAFGNKAVVESGSLKAQIYFERGYKLMSPTLGVLTPTPTPLLNGTNAWTGTNTWSGNSTFAHSTTTDSVYVTGNFTSQINRYFGDGSDGNLIVSSANFFPNSASSTVTTLAATSSVSLVLDSASSFATSTKVFIHSARGESAGQWEINTITGKNNDSKVINLQNPTASAYKATTGNDVTQILKVPQYKNVTFTGSGDISPYEHWRYGDGLTGGVVVFYASQSVVINNGVTVSLAGFGYLGGVNPTAYTSGEGTVGDRVTQTSPNGNGGGEGGTNVTVGQGGHSFSAVVASNNNAIGLIFGGGGGCGGNGGGNGGAGGGIFMPITPTFINFGTLKVNGITGSTVGAGNEGGGAGGAGGIINIISNQIVSTSTNIVDGGLGGTGNGTNANGGGGGGNWTAGTASAASGGAGSTAGGVGASGFVISGYPFKFLPYR